MTEELRQAVASQPHWYHTMELGPGVTTPGWFDLRPVLDRMPWPDVSGKRCLDVGTYDGHLAFELERRGASEVVATDLSDHAEWDWPVRLRARGAEELARIAGEQKGRGFEIAVEALGSKVTRERISVYDLTAERMGAFDVVVCGSLMLHLRDPMRALAAIRGVVGERFLSAETVDPGDGPPVARLDGVSDLCQWWIPNRAGHQRMIEAAGFDILEATALYEIPLGPAHPEPPRRLGRRRRGGIPHAAVLARPA